MSVNNTAAEAATTPAEAMSLSAYNCDKGDDASCVTIHGDDACCFSGTVVSVPATQTD